MQQNCNLQEAKAEEERMKARYENDIDIAHAQRDFELKKAAYDMEVHTKKAQSDLAYELQVRSSHLHDYKTGQTLCHGEGGYTSDLGLSKKPGTNSQYLK